jgi:hypothetical protein
MQGLVARVRKLPRCINDSLIDEARLALLFLLKIATIDFSVKGDINSR